MDDRYFDIKNYIGITRRMKYDFCHVKLWIKIKHIKLIGKWRNTQSRGPWQCVKCDFIWKTKAEKIMWGNTGCPNCAGTLPLTNEIIDKRLVDLNIPIKRGSDWSGYGRGTQNKKMTWICLKCKQEWKAKPGNILQEHTGCPHCRTPNYSKQSIKWLNEISQTQNIIIQHAENGSEFLVPGTKYKVDGYCKENNTIYEFYGDIWHGNPNLYSPEIFCSPFHKITAGQLYKQTKQKEEIIISLGYNLITMWEQDYVK